jgi:UDP-hydrolysing UDP-N-acetyl-D-glucosamine 2-epimerase
MQKKILIVTGSRAEWGLLKPLYKLLKQNTQIETLLLVTGSHLNSEGDNSIAEIENDQVEIDARLTVFTKNDAKDVEQQMFNAMARLYEDLPPILQQLQPDMTIFLGDRYEIFAVASVCRLLGLQTAHISGGELTRGAFDDQLRHAITKLSDYHFTATETYRQRVIQMGENPDCVFNCGEIGLYRFSQLQLLSPQATKEKLKLPANAKIWLATIHPETSFPKKVSAALDALLDRMLALSAERIIVFTAANADPEGERINCRLKEYAAKFPQKLKFFHSLGRTPYLSLAASAELVIGNSSSGIIEIPALRVPVINLGTRQTGRPHSATVVDAGFEADSFEKALNTVLNEEFRASLPNHENIYQGEDSCEKIADLLIKLATKPPHHIKAFYDLK